VRDAHLDALERESHEARQLVFAFRDPPLRWTVKLSTVSWWDAELGQSVKQIVGEHSHDATWPWLGRPPLRDPR
jgi:hypothetical protein